MRNPFDVHTLRFERIVDQRPVIADLQLTTRPPVFPGVDWDFRRDATMTFGKPTSFLAVITPGCTRLRVQVRFLDMRAVQKWEIQAQDPSPDSVLPRVAPQTLRERVPGCITREIAFDVDATRLARQGVGRFEVTWEWSGVFIHPNGTRNEPRPLGTTRFVVYAILGEPAAAPWRSAAGADPDRDLLRPDILDVACRSASGADSIEKAAGAVTRFFFNLGSDERRQSRMRLFVYGDTDDFVCDKEHHLFLCESLLAALNEPAGRRPVAISCEDLATAVCVFANTLGSDLERRLISIPKDDLVLARVKLIGLDPSSTLVWDHHIVAWSPSLEGVFDACVQLNMSENPGEDRFETPAGMPFGEDDDHPSVPGYRHRLLAERPGDCTFERLRDPTIDRASVRPADETGPHARRQAEYAQLLARARTPLSTLPFPLAADSLRAPDGFKPIEDESWERDGLTYAAWQRIGDAGQRFQLTAEWAPDRESAFELAAWRLTFYREPMVPSENPAFPNATTLATKDGRRMLVIYANAVVRLRSDGSVPLPSLDVFGPVLEPVLVPPG